MFEHRSNFFPGKVNYINIDLFKLIRGYLYNEKAKVSHFYKEQLSGCVDYIVYEEKIHHPLLSDLILSSCGSSEFVLLQCNSVMGGYSWK